MAQHEEPGDRTLPVPTHVIETVNKVVRTARQMLPEIGHEPTVEELAERLEWPGLGQWQGNGGALRP